MSDHVPTVPAPAVLPDGGGSVRVTRAKALRSSMSSSVPGGAALVAPQHVQPDDPPQGDDSGVSSTFNITKPKVPDTVTGVPDANATTVRIRPTRRWRLTHLQFLEFTVYSRQRSRHVKHVSRVAVRHDFLRLGPDVPSP